jgi:hypothetical protein
MAVAVMAGDAVSAVTRKLESAWGLSMAVVAAIGRYIVFGLLWG